MTPASPPSPETVVWFLRQAMHTNEGLITMHLFDKVSDSSEIDNLQEWLFNLAELLIPSPEA